MNRHLMLGLASTRLSREEIHWLGKHPPLGVILFARNCESPQQVKDLLDAVRQITGKASWAAIDEEGGRVNRMPWPPFCERQHAAQYGALMGRDANAAEKAVYRDALSVGQGLAELGFTHNCAPVLDIFHPEGHAIIGQRAYAADIDTVVRLGAACMRGLHDAGIDAVGKHFPGHGRANADSHQSLPEVNASLENLLAEAEPFRSLIGQGLRHVMTAHVVYSAADGTAATFSAFWVRQVLRGELGFSGRIWSDDLCMKGAGGDALVAARSALAAGCDVLPVCEPQAVAALLARLG